MDSFSTHTYVVTYKRNKSDPQATESFKTAEAAYHFALTVEMEGGITIVSMTQQKNPTTQKPSLRFD